MSLHSTADLLRAKVLKRSIAGGAELVRRASLDPAANVTVGDASPPPSSIPAHSRRSSVAPQQDLVPDALEEPAPEGFVSAALGGLFAVEEGLANHDAAVLHEAILRKKAVVSEAREGAELIRGEGDVFDDGTLLMQGTLPQVEANYVAKYSMVPLVTARVLNSWPRPAVKPHRPSRHSICLRRFCCCKLPLTNIPATIPVALFLAGAVILIIGLVFQQNTWLGAPMWTWGAAMMMSVALAVVVQMLVRLVLLVWLRNQVMVLMKVYFVLNVADRSLAIVVTMALMFVPLQLMIAYGLLSATRQTFYTVYGSILIFSVGYLVNQLATKLLILTIETPKVFFRRLAVLFWERDLLTRLARRLVAREMGEIGIVLQTGTVPERRDQFRLFSRGPPPVSEEDEVRPRTAAQKVLSELRYDEPVLEQWAQYVKGSDEWTLGVSDAIIALESAAARDIRRLAVAFKFVASLWKRLHKQIQETVSEKDLEVWLEGDAALAKEAMSLFNSSLSGVLTFEECVEVAGLVLRDRGALKKLMKDRTTFGKLLFRFVGIVVWPITFIVFSAVVGLDLASILAPLITFVLGLTFIFGQSMLRMWHSFLVIFIARAYEPGDYIAPDGMQELLVEEIELLSTSGCNAKGNHIRIANWMLWERALINYGRSAEYRMRLFFRVEAESCGEEQLREIEKGLREYISGREENFRVKTFAFWLSVGHQEPWAWNELDELAWHTIAFQVKLRVSAGNPGAINPIVMKVLLHFKKLCKDNGVSPIPSSMSTVEEKMKDRGLTSDTVVTTLDPRAFGFAFK
jgi:small-conductance mechanosensitive channel